MSAYVATPYSRYKIREIANLFRQAFSLNDAQFFPVLHLLEIGLREIYSDFNFEIVDNRELPTQYAVTYPSENLIVLRQEVYDGAYNDVARDRFTIAHEIGHYVLHQPTNIALARNQLATSIPPYKDPEWQANTFAGELLAPPHIIRGLSVPEIMLACGVSRSVAEIQLKNLK